MSDTFAKRAELAYQEGNLEEAAAAYEEAAKAYAAQGDSILAAEMWNNCGVVLIKLERGKEALSMITPTLQTFQEHGDCERLGIAYGNLAAALEICGNAQEAEEAYLKAAELLRECDKAELRLYALKALSHLQLKQGKQLQALATFRSALEETPRPSLQHRALKKLLEIPWKLLSK